MVRLSILVFTVDTSSWSPGQKLGLAVFNGVAGTITDKLTMSHEALRPNINVQTIETYVMHIFHPTFFSKATIERVDPTPPYKNTQSKEEDTRMLLLVRSKEEHPTKIKVLGFQSMQLSGSAGV